MEARGITQEMLMDGVNKSSMKELTEMTLAADKVITF
jgi:sulfur relay (sulfurtransferase) complex TusBCD TusD component (DsrE family)